MEAIRSRIYQCGGAVTRSDRVHGENRYGRCWDENVTSHTSSPLRELSACEGDKHTVNFDCAGSMSLEWLLLRVRHWVLEVELSRGA